MNLLFMFASRAFAATINTGIPGTENVAQTGPVGVVANFYQFALMFGGLLAFAAIVYGGLKYTFAAGNPEGQRDAKDQVTQALLGLLLLVGAAIVLNLLNPNLTNLTLDTGTLQNVPPPANQNQQTGVSQIKQCAGATYGLCPPGYTCTSKTDPGFTLLVTQGQSSVPPAAYYTCVPTPTSGSNVNNTNSAQSNTNLGGGNAAAACGANGGTVDGACADKAQDCLEVNGRFQCVTVTR